MAPMARVGGAYCPEDDSSTLLGPVQEGRVCATDRVSVGQYDGSAADASETRASSTG
jgi:hypothetical protein